MKIEALPVEGGINFCKVDGETYFRVGDVAELIYPATHHRNGRIAMTEAAKLVKDKFGDVKKFYNNVARRGCYMPHCNLEPAILYLQHIDTQAEVRRLVGIRIGGIVKRKKEDAAAKAYIADAMSATGGGTKNEPILEPKVAVLQPAAAVVTKRFDLLIETVTNQSEQIKALIDLVLAINNGIARMEGNLHNRFDALDNVKQNPPPSFFQRLVAAVQ